MNVQRDAPSPYLALTGADGFVPRVSLRTVERCDGGVVDTAQRALVAGSFLTCALRGAKGRAEGEAAVVRVVVGDTGPVIHTLGALGFLWGFREKRQACARSRKNAGENAKGRGGAGGNGRWANEKEKRREEGLREAASSQGDCREPLHTREQHVRDFAWQAPKPLRTPA